MSKILGGLTDEWQPVIYLAADLEGQPDGRVHRRVEESYRRACKRLAAKGLVELGYASMVTGNAWPAHERPPHGDGQQRARLVVRRAQADR